MLYQFTCKLFCRGSSLIKSIPSFWFHIWGPRKAEPDCAFWLWQFPNPYNLVETWTSYLQISSRSFHRTGRIQGQHPHGPAAYLSRRPIVGVSLAPIKEIYLTHDMLQGYTRPTLKRLPHVITVWKLTLLRLMVVLGLLWMVVGADVLAEIHNVRVVRSRVIRICVAGGSHVLYSTILETDWL